MKQMKPTSKTLLLGVSFVIAAATAILYNRYFGTWGSKSWQDLTFPWILTIVCAFAARWVRATLKDNKVGQDRSQVQPLTLSRWLIVGTAAAWLGGIVGGINLGGVLWALPRWQTLTAAATDGPIFIVGVFTGLLLAAAGLWLEKECQLPPEDKNSPQANQETPPPSVGWEL